MQGKLVVFSGAGLSADSGIQTFRDDKKGLWNNRNLTEVCDIYSARFNKALIYDFYNSIMACIAQAQPNEAHLALAKAQQEYGSDKVILITQNVDDLLERAGAKEVYHVHGDGQSYTCLDCGESTAKKGDYFEMEQVCEHCGSGALKPSIVFFGERAPGYRILDRVVSKLNPEDYLLCIGTSWNVIPVQRVLPYYVRLQEGHAIQIDLKPTQRHLFDRNFEGTAAKLTPAVLREIFR